MSQHARVFLSSPHMGDAELQFVRQAFDSNWIAPLGPHVDAFEREFCEVVGYPLSVISDRLPVISDRLSVISERSSGNTAGTVQGAAGIDQIPVGSASSSPITNNLITTNPVPHPPKTNNPITNNPVPHSPITNNPVPDPLITDNPITNNLITAAALSSGTAALHLALKLVGVQRGDEVFCSSLTFSASANPIVYEGAKPVFIDSERESWNMDPARLEQALADRAKKGKLPRAVILVHLYGQCAEIGAVARLCDTFNVALIEDAAEALGAVYYGANQLSGAAQAQQLSVIGESWTNKKPVPALPHNREPITNNQEPITNNQELITDNQMPPRHGIAPGTIGRLGIFSFNGNKIITTSGGGMLVSNDETLIKKARFWATQSRDPAPHYQHSEIGYNYRLSNVLAGIGRGQLRVLADRVNARRANCAFYQKAFADLPGIEFMPEASWNRCTRWLTCILVDPRKFGADRDGIRLALEAENIEARPVWKPMHLQPVFAQCDKFGGEVAEDLFNRGLCLPSGSNLVEGDLQRVVEVVRKCHKR